MEPLESFCLPYKQTCQTPAPGAAVGADSWVGCLLQSCQQGAGWYTNCHFPGYSRSTQSRTFAPQKLSYFKPSQAACVCLGAVTTQSWLCHGTASPACGRSWCWWCWASLFCPSGTLPSLWAQVQPGHFSVHSSSDAVTVDPDWRKRSFWASFGLYVKFDFLELQGWVIYGFSHDSSCYLSLKRAFLSYNVNQ